MKPEAQRVAIAEACGKKTCTHNPSKWERHGTDGDSELYCTECKMCLSDMRAPDYINDLNAMHSAENTLTWCQLSQMNEILAIDVLKPDERIFHATASQRAEAFLKTIGKWVEDSTPEAA